MSGSIATKIIRKENPNALNDNERNKKYANVVSKLVRSDALFEYYDVVLQSENTVLKRHMDYDNDGITPGYKLGFSYSYPFEHEGRRYRVNIICCTRICCAFHMKISKNKQQQQQQQQN